MTSLRVRQIRSKLRDLFESHLDLRDLGSADKDRETKVLTRCLAAFAIYNLTGCSEEEAAKAVWDGSDDNGIDAACHDASESRVILVQAKWIHAGAGEPEAKDIAVFANGIKDLVEQDFENFGSRLQPKLPGIGQALLTPGTTVHIVLISTGASSVARHGEAALDRILSELNGGMGESPIATKEIMGLAEIYPALASGPTNEKIVVDANILDWSYVAQPFAAYFGVIDGAQLKSWWLRYGKRLVAMNIRHALGATDVNNQIRQTAATNPDHFWYFNNGITLIAEEAPRAPATSASRASGYFQLRGASIVNGAQTASTLARIDNDEALGRVRVPIRVILLEGTPQDFGSEVTRTNNLQNRIEARDFVAQDSEQHRLQLEMGMEDVEYQYVRSEDFVASATSCDLIELTTALACASGDPSYAVAIKTGIGRFFADLTKAPYKAIYNHNLSGARAFNSILIQREKDNWIEAKRSAATKRSGIPWGVLIHGNRILSAGVFKRIGAGPLTSSISEFKGQLSTMNLEMACLDVYERMVSTLERDYPSKFLAVLFKNPSISKDVFDKVNP